MDLSKTMLRVYCDNNGYESWLKEYEKQGKIKLFGFPYENAISTGKVSRKVTPSNPTWQQAKIRYEEANFSWIDLGPSEKFDHILKILNLTKTGNIDVDVQHLDTAYKNKCHIFLTTDKHDIIQNKEYLEPLLKLVIFHPSEDVDHIRKIITSQELL